MIDNFVALVGERIKYTSFQVIALQVRDYLLILKL